MDGRAAEAARILPRQVARQVHLTCLRTYLGITHPPVQAMARRRPACLYASTGLGQNEAIRRVPQ